MSDELIKDIENEMPAAENAFSYCAMNFNERLDAIREWQAVTTPEKIKSILSYVKELEEKAESLESKVDELEFEIESLSDQ